MEIIYREAGPKDAQALLDYLKVVGGESGNLTFGAEGLPFSEAQEAAFLAHLQSAPHSRMLLAFDGRSIVGCACVEGNGHPRFGHRCDFSITVRKSHWGRGIGSGLMARQIEFAKNAGAEILSLEVRADNERAIRLYKKFDFVPFGSFPGFFKIDGQYFDAVYMTKIYCQFKQIPPFYRVSGKTGGFFTPSG